MNKRIKPLALVFVMILSLLATAVPVLAEPSSPSCTFSIEADKTSANPGDTITFTVYMQQTGTQTCLEGTLVIPDGLTFVPDSGTLTDNLAETLGWTGSGEGVWWVPERMLLHGLGAENYTRTDKLALMKFKCTVDSDTAVKVYKVDMVDLVAEGGSTEYYKTKNPNCVPAEVTVAAVPNPATGISLDKETLSLVVNDSEQLNATVTPDNTTDTVVWTSDRKAVATVDNMGKVTAVAPGTATITATAGDKTATCAVTVTAAPCAHANITPVSEQASTCADKGWDAYKKCNDCGKLFDMSGNPINEIPYRSLVPHDYTFAEKSIEAVKTPGTCRDEAVFYYTCGVCGDIEHNDDHTFTGDKNSENYVGGTTKVGAKEPDHNNNIPGYTGDIKCNGCGVILSTGSEIPVGTHVPADVWTTDETDHWKVCNVVGCGVVIDGTKAAHSSTGDNVATCQKKAVCDVCGVSYGELAAHNPDADWTTDENGHWHKCLNDGCNEKLDYATHTPDYEEATYEHGVTCTECGRELAQKLEEPVVRVEVPFKLVVKKTGELAPGKETFKFIAENFGAEVDYTLIKDTIETNGEKTYEGSFIFTVKQSQIGNFSEGFAFHQIKGNAEGWTYDETVYYAIPLFVDDYSHVGGWTFFKLVDGERPDESNIAEEIIFTNSYNANKPVNKSESPKTGDNSNPVLWVVLLFVSGAGLTGTTLYFRKKRTNNR